MSDRKKLLDELAVALDELCAFRPASRAHLDRWYELARKLEAKLVQEGGLSPEVPTILWN